MILTQPGGVLRKLVENKESIEQQLPWKDLDNDARVERLREYTKKTIAEVIQRQETYKKQLETRLKDLENHQHNSKGEVIIEQKLGDIRNKQQVYDDSPYITTPGGLSPVAGLEDDSF